MFNTAHCHNPPYFNELISSRDVPIRQKTHLVRVWTRPLLGLPFILSTFVKNKPSHQLPKANRKSDCLTDDKPIKDISWQWLGSSLVSGSKWFTLSVIVPPSRETKLVQAACFHWLTRPFFCQAAVSEGCESQKSQMAWWRVSRVIRICVLV